MAELLKSKDDCVPDAVDWEEVRLKAFPENVATAARDGDCVFADCSTGRIARLVLGCTAAPETMQLLVVV
ncbi:hypothetical protein DIPPA_25330 [Diplonema papillatum]|nr:hypothetical protein DIPPA_25330 [Diplonema papillatum]